MWRREFDDLLNGIAGAFLFGIPLLYTMEVWDIGSDLTPLHMLLYLGLTYVALVALNRATGFRRNSDETWSRSLTDSIEALALGALVAGFSLIILQRITFDLAYDVILGKIVLETMPCAIGVGMANGLLRREANDEQEAEQRRFWHATLVDAGGTMLGATVVGLSIAPTDEVGVIAASLPPWWLWLIMAASLLISYVIVFQAEFGDHQQRRRERGLFQSPLSETIASYIISLVFALVTLRVFNQLGAGTSLHQVIDYTIVLGLPATVGGAAGRLAV
ncbi:MAG TPA: TIGR02587 family membrane protein [Herpetosiphon sp.]|uniref:Integral membrane protein TIGR02587 n=1 Tax=Herpetosiphon aurantiacus (strain ATCC 23779 / DSM 785 / 114-95) TaxID=316274 RepID=A9AY51_HERA2|nr:TIGR02587 family membrane protein [Herpetosiphon sp.]ABX06933.1 putative integral membrane protein TIGR02587 [Herpetosiphon aurantiacus DSM 785]HBW50079.1 TIGR02587 family membrane protein [Herpetosiphon sp.]